MSTEKVVKYTSEGSYFYEPFHCVIKANLVEQFAMENHLQCITPGCAYLIGNEAQVLPLARCFRIEAQFSYNSDKLKQYCKQNQIKKANLAARHFFDDVAALRKTSRLADGGEDYFFFTKNSLLRPIVYHCKKINSI